jgi:citrate lyase subunit beta/citryl-CoA lyase
MPILVRRSNLIVRLNDRAAVESAWRHDADAITLDLAGSDADARARMKEAIALAARGAAEVFVRVTPDALEADCDDAVQQGLRGIVLDEVSSPSQVNAAEAKLSVLERMRNLRTGSLQLIVLIGSAAGVWDVRAILKASSRISQVMLDEVSLARDLDIEPLVEFDPFVYARGRIVVEAIAAKVMPVGIAYPLSLQAEAASPEEIHALAVKGKNLGMKGVLCAEPSWVAPVNAAFTPTAELVDYNKRVREAFAAGVAAGTAAVPLDGRMIDVPVDEWAIVVLETAQACAARDAEKLAAISAGEGHASPAP